ncbi:hypothetical protein GCM10022381_13260 [Leifsonia kafniensis]|uniref:TNT domain-containing protein n=1 Tax=Leifsonia kafniensis TaxID=475957 RepID=A0ABP7KBB0_9MICO
MGSTLIEPSAIPGLTIQPGVIASAATNFTKAAGSVRDQGAAVLTKWSGLSAVYSAPESGTLLAVMTPVGTETTTLGDQITSIGSALSTLAETVEPIRTKLVDIKQRAETFVTKAHGGITVDIWDSNHPAWDSGLIGGILLTDFADMGPAHIAWDKYQPWVDENNALLAEVNTQVVLLDEARAACVNTLNGLRTDVCVVPESAITIEQLNAAGDLPWGATGNGDRSCYESFNDGFDDAFYSTVAGLGSLISYNPETGDWGDWGNAGSTWVEMATTLGAIALIGPAVPLLANLAPKGSWAQEFGQGVLDRQVAVVEGLVGSPEAWQENPSKAAGAIVFNVGSFFIPGAGAVGGAAKAGLLGARVASLVEHASVLLGKGGAVVLDAVGGAGTKVGSALTHLMDVLKLDGGSGPRFEKALDDLEDTLKKADVDVTKPDLTPGGGHGPSADAPNGGHGTSEKPGSDGPGSEKPGHSEQPDAEKPNGSDGSGSEKPVTDGPDGDATPGGHPDQGDSAPGETTPAGDGAPGQDAGGTSGHGPVDSNADAGEGWTKAPVEAEGNPRPDGGDGQVFTNHGDSGEYPTRPEKVIDEETGEFVQNPDTALNEKTWDLVSDPDAPYGSHPDGTPLKKPEYDERFVQGNEGNWDRYPSFDGVVPGTRVTYTDPVAFVKDYGTQFDRIGPPNGKYLGLVQDGKAASFEQRGLPVSSLRQNYYEYSFTPDAAAKLKAAGIQIEISRIAPAFGREGGGLQVRFLEMVNGKMETLTLDQLGDFLK